jgi:peroxiredoxin
MNDDSRPDILVVDTERVIWFENPDWQLHTLVEHATKKDNVSIAPADIDGDGKIDFALGADWRPSDTHGSGSLQWISRGATPDAPWTVHPIGVEPTIHRIRFADIDGDGRQELLVVPLFGRDTTAPNYAEAPVRILAYQIPRDDPVHDTWTPQVINDELHVAHNFWPTDLDRDGRLDIVVASFEGVSLLRRQTDGHWRRTLVGSGNQQTSPSRGASEVKHGRLASGADYLATIEPWHGFQVVVYTPPPGKSPEQATDGTLWTRHVLDEQLKWGHAIWCADLDGDSDEELVIGVRDTKDAANPCGLRIYDPSGSKPATWNAQRIDPSGVAIEDLAVADLDSDQRADVVAVGRATKNVRIYWNQTPRVVQADPRSVPTALLSAGEDAYPDATLPNCSGGQLSLAEAKGREATVLVCLSIECPISQEYTPTLNRLAEQYRDRGVRLIGIDPAAGETLEAMARYAGASKLKFPLLKDTDGRVSRRLRFEVTPEVCVFDRDGRTVYRGRIDDRYRARQAAKTGSGDDVAAALDAVLAGKPVSAARTKAVGCPIPWGTSRPAK